MILEKTIKQASQLLKNKNIISHELDAEIILSDIMGISKEFLMVNNQINISKKTIKKYGSVSKQVCLTMVKNLSKISKTNIRMLWAFRYSRRAIF